jgi:protein SCO1
MPKPKLVFGALVVALAASVSAMLLLRPRVHPRSAESYAYRAAAESGELPVLWTAPAFSYPNQAGKTTTLADLDGHAFIADFIFTQCATVCPRISAKMVLMQRRIPDAGLRFVSFSVDPDHDSPEVLARYAAKWNSGESRWLLLSTTQKALGETAQGMRVAVERADSAADPILHSSMFFLVDGKHQVRGIYDSNDDTAVERLMKDAHALAGGAAPVAPAAAPENASGAELYAALGCAACHTDQMLAPPLTGLSGSKVKLEGGATVTANEAYLKESIVAPGEKVVASYVRLMPSYGGHVSPAQLDRLVAYIASLPAAAPAPSASAEAALAVDPVCGMDVHVAPGTPEAEHAGKTFHFCSEVCRERFVANPETFDKR